MPTSTRRKKAPSRQVRGRVARVIEDLRPLARDDGGDIELVDVLDDGTVQLRLLGACVGCPSASMTLTQGIEKNLRREVPEVRRVVCIP
jgi:Fe-S cluster biogenesis protein NfuA